MRIMSAFDSWPVHLVTTDARFAYNVRENFSNIERVATVVDANLHQKMRMVLCLFQMLWIVIITRPRVVISTGAAPGCLAIVLGKLTGAKTMWIDSIANAERLSVSGRVVGRWCDVRLTQWQHLADSEIIEFWGAVL